jgi:hypothetical protein
MKTKISAFILLLWLGGGFPLFAQNGTCIPSTVYTLTASAPNLCGDGAEITFALSGTDPGRIYQLYRDSATVVATLTGNGCPAIFNEAVTEAGTYTARAVALPEYCPAAMAGSYPVAPAALPSPPLMFGSGTYCSYGEIWAVAYAVRWDDGVTNETRTITASGTYSAVSVSEEGCESAPSSLVVTIGYPGAHGQPADDMCGCTSTLTDCHGVCKSSCGMVPWTVCGSSGITFVSDISYEIGSPLNWHNADDMCTYKGMRLPTLEQLLCMCVNKRTLPGGYAPQYIWSSTAANGSNHYVVNFAGCIPSYVPDVNSRHVRCVN